MAGGKNARMSIAGAVPLGSAQMMEQQIKNLQKGQGKGGGDYRGFNMCNDLGACPHEGETCQPLTSLMHRQ